MKHFPGFENMKEDVVLYATYFLDESDIQTFIEVMKKNVGKSKPEYKEMNEEILKFMQSLKFEQALK
jgi:hypothetical protein